MNSITSTLDSVSPRSTSASSAISEEACPNDLFSGCNNISFIKKLSDAKFPVYLVSSAETNQLYAMKIFPWENNAPSSFYAKEVRFAQFTHRNIISMIYYVSEQECSSSDEYSKISYILMDYANYGDFFDVLISYKIPFDDILIRTYFHQLVDALEALHSQGAAHLDLKLENLLLTSDFTLKLTDFDLSYIYGDGKVKTRGTKNFRAPELLAGRCIYPQSADIYSAGILLFLLKSGGRIPYKEEIEEDELDMEMLKENNPRKFWEKQCELLAKKSSFFSEDFKALFMWMTQREPMKRPTLAQIKNSRWYKKETYSTEELSQFMKTKFEAL